MGISGRITVSPKFEKRFKAGADKLKKCHGKNPPRPEQFRFVLEWPWFGLADRIERCANLFGGLTISPPGLNLFGGSYQGKTVSALASLQKFFVDYGRLPLLFWRSVDLGRAITDASRKGDDELETLLGNLNSAGILFIDDLDKAKFTPRVQSELYGVIDERANANKPMIVTTNCTGPEFAAKFEDSIGIPVANRLLESCIHVDFDDSSFDAESEIKAAQENIRGRIDLAVRAARVARHRKRIANARADRKAEIERQESEARANAEREQIMRSLRDGTYKSLPQELQRRITIRMRLDASREQRQAEENAQAEIEGREACAVL